MGEHPPRVGGGYLAALRHAPADREVEPISDRRVRMICPSKSHAGGHETTPSFYVWVGGPRIGQGKCYGCDMTTTWRETCELLGLPRNARFISEDVPTSSVADAEVASMLGPPRRELGDESLLPWPPDQRWRGISGRLVSALGGTLVPSRRGTAGLRLPVSVRERRVGHIYCTLEKPPTGELGYVNSSGTWVKHAVYPYDFVREREPRVVCLVEGVRDPLVTIQNGMMALTIMGSTNWSDRCAQLVLRLSPDCIVIMMDPDAPGERARAACYADLAPHVDTRCVVLPSRMVPSPKTGVPERVKLLDPADLDRARFEEAVGLVGVVKTASGWHARARRRAR